MSLEFFYPGRGGFYSFDIFLISFERVRLIYIPADGNSILFLRFGTNFSEIYFM